MYDIVFMAGKFLSTLSLRRATFACAGWFQVVYYFYPRSPCGERPYIIRHAVNLHSISIHALLAESDGTVVKLQCIPGNFYPRSPCGERRGKSSRRCVLFRISIHALLAESDGGAPSSCFGRITFLSTLSLRRATPLR